MFDALDYLTNVVGPVLLLLGFLALGITAFILVRRRFAQGSKTQKNNFTGTLATLLGWSLLLMVVVLVLPIPDEVKVQILTLLGLLLTFLMAFSSTSFVSNAMAGFMLRGVNNFSVGDFVRVGEQFGRVTEKGFFHTEIQTEDRDLTTIPNLYLVSNPVSVVRASGTIVSAEVSLGYDNAVEKIEALLLQAATDTGLEDPFVYIRQLGDSSIIFRVAGFLREVKQLLSVRSALRKNMVSVLHSADVEVVTPSYINQRRIAVADKVLGTGDSYIAGNKADAETDKLPESLIFDKAEIAEQVEILDDRKKLLLEKISKLEEDKKQDKDSSESLDEKIAVLQRRLDYVVRTAEKLAGDMQS